jgi:Tfp pilus assembly protein PilF
MWANFYREISTSLADAARRWASRQTFYPRRISWRETTVFLGVVIAGCQSVQKQTAQRSAKCDAMCARAREARKSGNTDLANQCLDEAMRQRPRDVETRRQLAETMWKNGRRAEAVAVFVELCGQQPKDTNLASRLAVMQWETDLHAAAVKTAGSVLAHDPQNQDAWRIKARGEVEQGLLEEALASYNQLSQLAPEDFRTLIELGELHLLRGHPDRACPIFQTAVQHPQASKAERANSEWLLGIAYSRSRRWALAVSVLESAINCRPSSADDWCFLAWNRLQCGDLSGAQADLRSALQRDPKSQAALMLSHQMADYESQNQASYVTPTSFRESATAEFIESQE